MAQAFLNVNYLDRLEGLRNRLTELANQPDAKLNWVKKMMCILIGLYMMLKNEVEADKGDQKDLLREIDLRIEQLRTEQALHAQRHNVARLLLGGRGRRGLGGRGRRGLGRRGLGRSQISHGSSKSNSPRRQSYSRVYLEHEQGASLFLFFIKNIEEQTEASSVLFSLATTRTNNSVSD